MVGEDERIHLLMKNCEYHVEMKKICVHSTELMKSCAGVGRGALALVRVPGQPSETNALNWVLTSLKTRVLY